jgi:hypothetical protein
LEIIMKTSQLIARAVASAAIAVCGSTLADALFFDEVHSFKGPQPATTRSEVREDRLDAEREQALLKYNDAKMGGPSGPDIGARGPAGSRYTGLTREEVRAELKEYQEAIQSGTIEDIYRPN